ncbi:MAG: hypothetical protein RLZZ499_2002, partial [Cyanobacteriota bacterium]
AIKVTSHLCDTSKYQGMSSRLNWRRFGQKDKLIKNKKIEKYEKI